MEVLNVWDWKYKLILSDSINQKVRNFSKILKPEEKEIYEAMIDFYSGFYSFDISNLERSFGTAPFLCEGTA